MSDKYAAIAAERGHFPVRLMCAALGVSVGGFYDAQTRAAHGPSHARVAENERLRVAVRAMFKKYRNRYGAPRVHRELRASGISVAKHRVARFMQEDQLVARPRRRFVRTTDSTHADAIAPNLLGRNFTVTAQTALDRVWVADMTYIPTRAGWLFLAIVLDLASRRVVGWAMGAKMDVTLPLAALQMAVATRRPAPGCIHHSDRGSAYSAGAYRAALHHAGALASMSRRADCYDNAVAESFFATLEHELIVAHDWATHTQARRDIFEFIEVWYNRERRHSSLDYVSPVQYEQDRFAHSARAA
jgi:transposase InsO family protein